VGQSRRASYAPAIRPPSRPETESATRSERKPGPLAPLTNGAVFYPDMMPGPPPVASMFNAEPATHWPPLLDVDADPTPFAVWNERIGGQFK
jgi:hypothetical protein